MANTQVKTEEYEANGPDNSKQKQVLITRITGKVKWFNVKRGYGFVCRDDNHEDIFIHQSAIVKCNPKHPRKSVGEDEHILFDIVKGDKGNEAANVSAIDGNCVKGSDYALRYPRGRGRGRGSFRGRGGNRSRVVSEEGEMRSQEFFRGGRGGGRYFRGSRPYVVQYRKPPTYDIPPQYYYDFDYYRGPMRGPRGLHRGPTYRGGPPREMPIKFEGPFENDFYERRPVGRGRPRGRGRGRGRRRGQSRGGNGGSGNGGVFSRDTVKNNSEKDEDEQQQQQPQQQQSNEPVTHS